MLSLRLRHRLRASLWIVPLCVMMGGFVPATEVPTASSR